MTDPRKRGGDSGRVEGGVWSRSRAALSIAAGVAGEELKHRLRTSLGATAERLNLSEIEARIEQAKVLADGLGRLKGAFMKGGQLLSLDASDYLPPEAVEILGRLQGGAEPVPLADLERVLDEELGERRARLEELSQAPAASASIGQVHRARVDGRPVAVKIQYPGVAESIDSDIEVLERLASTWLMVSRRRIDMHDAFEELRRVLHLEADYTRERAYLERFRALLAGDPVFVVPEALPALSARRVLTMSWMEGVPLGEWLVAERAREVREHVGRSLLDLYYRELFTWGTVQTDPNFGNFLVRDDGTIALLDFGATVEYDAEFRADYTDLLRTVASRDEKRMFERAVSFGLLDAREGPEARRLFAEMLEGALEPFETPAQPFAFGDADYAARARSTVIRFVRALEHSPPPRRLLFLHRKLGGLFQLLKRLDAHVDLAPYWDKMLGGHAAAPA